MPSTRPDSPKQNRILAALSAKEYVRLVDDLELVSLERGQVLYEPGDIPDCVYFPTTCIVSRIFTTENGSSAELAMTGDDGVVGISLILGGETIIYRVDVQIPGNAYRLKAEIMRWELDQGGELQRLSLRYTQALMTQMAQSVVCNRHHSVDQQLCRWLLLNLDRVSGDQLDITQERIANTLGVRREGVTEAAGHLQAAGLIRYRRGHITVVDRPGLEARVCECYATVKAEEDRLYLLAPELRVRNWVRPNPATLRRRAEARLAQQTSAAAPAAPIDSARLLHELQVHQIELEIQQEELLAAYDEVDAQCERYADIYDFAPAGYFTLDPLGTIVDLNLAGAILLGIKRSQTNRYRFTTSVRPDCAAAFERFVANVLESKGKQRCEIALLPHAHRGEAIVGIEAVADESGRECRMVVIDISAEKQAERALFERDQYQRALLDNFPFNVWLKDEQGRFLAANTPLAIELGWPSAEALIGKTVFDVFPRRRAETYHAEDLAVLRGGKIKCDEELVDKNGEKRWFEVYKSALAIDGQHVGTVGFARDITERHTLQQALVESEKQQRSFMENLPLSVTIAQDGVLRYINPKAAELTGYAAEECVGRSFLPLIFPADRAKAKAGHEQRMRGQATPSSFELRIVSKAGRIIDCRCYFSLVNWDNRIASLGIFEDVSEQKRIKAATGTDSAAPAPAPRGSPKAGRKSIPGARPRGARPKTTDRPAGQ
jgi:PAS domain S-box-containing protein